MQHVHVRKRRIRRAVGGHAGRAHGAAHRARARQVALLGVRAQQRAPVLRARLQPRGHSQADTEDLSTGGGLPARSPCLACARSSALQSFAAGCNPGELLDRQTLGDHARVEKYGE